MPGPPVSRLGDLCTGHGCWPPRPSSEASPDVYCNGIPVHREADGWHPHTCPDIPETHASVLASGSQTVYVNRRQISRIGDPVVCGSRIAEGSPDVYAGG